MFVTLFSLLLPWSASPLAQAEPPAPAKSAKPAPAVAVDTGPVETHVLPLKHANCHEVRDMLRTLLNLNTVFADDRTNAVICSVDARRWEQISRLIGQLDRPSESRAQAALEMLPIRHRPAEEIAKRITEVLSRRGEDSFSRIAADSQRSLVLVSGSPGFIAQAKAISEALDTSAPAVRLEFTILHAAAVPAEPSKPGESLAAWTTEVPADLAQVAKELERFGKIRLLCRMTSMAAEHEGFKIRGTIGNSVDVEIQGRLERVSADGHIRVGMEAALSRRGASAGTQAKGGVENRLFSLETSLLLERGQTLVLGTAPTGWNTGESAILVIQGIK